MTKKTTVTLFKLEKQNVIVPNYFCSKKIADPLIGEHGEKKVIASNLEGHLQKIPWVLNRLENVCQYLKLILKFDGLTFGKSWVIFSRSNDFNVPLGKQKFEPIYFRVSLISQITLLVVLIISKNLKNHWKNPLEL